MHPHDLLKLLEDEGPRAGHLRTMLGAGTGSTKCPLCARTDVHEHTSLEIVIYRNGVKYGRSLGSSTQPLAPTPDMLEAGAQRLVSWEDGSTWPDSWNPVQIAAARNEVERVWRSMWVAADGSTKKGQ